MKKYILISLLLTLTFNGFAKEVEFCSISKLNVNLLGTDTINNNSSAKTNNTRVTIGAFNVIEPGEVGVYTDKNGNIVCTYGTFVENESDIIKLYKITEAINKSCPMDIGASESLFSITYDKDLNELQCMLYVDNEEKASQNDYIVSHGISILQHIKLSSTAGVKDFSELLISTKSNIHFISVTWHFKEVELSSHDLRNICENIKQTKKSDKLLKVVEEIATPSDVDTTKIYDVVEVRPTFPEGTDSLSSWLHQNMKYPQEAYNVKKQGRVIIQFVVTRDGSIDKNSIRIVRGVDPSIDAEAIRLVKSMPKWIPGKQNDVPVKCKYLLPITFKI